MARERMVTRTIYTTVCDTMCMLISNATVENRVFTLTGKVTEEKEALKALKEAYETDDLKVVHIVSVSYAEALYGMSEIEFIKQAKLLPPR